MIDMIDYGRIDEIRMLDRALDRLFRTERELYEAEFARTAEITRNGSYAEVAAARREVAALADSLGL
jgi:hypothetical protein